MMLATDKAGGRFSLQEIFSPDEVFSPDGNEALSPGDGLASILVCMGRGF
jgi:hypothetical protein